jgi:hypothetical protein
MWSAFVRQFAAYALTRRGKKLFAFLGAMLLVFATTLLIDMQLYVTAGFTGLMAAVATGAFGVQHVKLKRRQRERDKRVAADAIRRTEKAKARSERIGQTKAAFTGALGSAAQAVADAAACTARFFAEAIAEMAQEVSDAYDETSATISSAMTATAQAVSRGAANVMQAKRDAFVKAFAFLRRANAPRASSVLAEHRLAGPHAIPRIGLRPDLH